jgi:hypothetical protein
MSNPKFRLPNEMPVEPARFPLSTRVKAETKAILEKAAKANHLPLASLAANVLDDYAAWLCAQGKSEARRK